jgi:ABC-type antimicrobial peptide transport system permease subunit
MLGVIGSVIGTITGLLLLYFFNTFAGTGFPITYQWGNILLVAAIATIAGTLASAIPAQRSANLNPMEAIKNG